MITKILMPQVGQDLEVGRIVRWIKKVGDQIKKGEALCEVETEKAIVEVPAPVDGILLKILFQDDTAVKILAEIGFVGDPADLTAILAPNADQIKATPLPVELIEKAVSPLPMEGTQRIRISPKAKKTAHEHNLAIEKLTGSGPQGRIVEKDVLDYLGNKLGTAPAQKPQPTVVKEGLLPLSKIRKVTAQRLQQSKQNIPHFYISISVDMTLASKRQKELNEQFRLPKGETISINDFIVRACALALKEFPEMNGSYSDAGIQLSKNIDIGVAVAVEDGLVVPVIENCDRQEIKELSSRIRQAVQSAKNGRQSMTRPGRFTISNLGMYHVDDFAAIINPPEVGILAVGSIKKQLVVQEDDSMGIRQLMKITLSVDHRVVDGVLAAKFLNRVKDILETFDGF